MAKRRQPKDFTPTEVREFLKKTFLSLDLDEEGAGTREWKAIDIWLNTFYPFQLDWLLDWSSHAALLKCRQIGGSHVYAAAAVLWGLLGQQTSLVSVGEREGMDLLEKCKKHCEFLTEFGSKFAQLHRDSALTIIMNKGGRSKGRIDVLPATSGGRGKTGNIILDEFAYHRDAEAVWDGAAGTTLHGGKMRALSTPNGPGNLFHTLCTNNKYNSGYKIHKVTIDQAIADGMKIDLDECWLAAHHDERVFNQLYRCNFLDNELQYIPHALIEAACTSELPPFDGECFAGIDVGLSVDLTALVVVRVTSDGQRWLVHLETVKRTDFDHLDGLIAKCIKYFNCRRIGIDATGVGAFPAQQLVKKYGHRIDPVLFTLKSKEDMATTTFEHFKDGRLRLCGADVALKNDIAAIQRIVTTSGNVRYDAPHTAEGHADRFWALALALKGCSGPDRRRWEQHEHFDDT